MWPGSQDGAPRLVSRIRYRVLPLSGWDSCILPLQDLNPSAVASPGSRRLQSIPAFGLAPWEGAPSLPGGWSRVRQTESFGTLSAGQAGGRLKYDLLPRDMNVDMNFHALGARGGRHDDTCLSSGGWRRELTSGPTPQGPFHHRLCSFWPHWLLGSGRIPVF